MALSRDFSLVAASSALNLGIGLITTPIITRLVLPEDYGNWSLFCVFTNVIYLFCTLGFDQVLVRYFYSENNVQYRRRLISICWFYPFLLATLIIIPLVYLLNIFFLDWSITIYFFLWINILLSIHHRITGIVFRFTDHVAYLSFFTILHKAFYVGVAIILLMHHWDGFMVLSFCTIFSTLFVVVGSILISRSHWSLPSFHYQDLNISEYFRYGIPLMIASSVYMVFQTMDKLIIKRFCSAEELGIYASAASLIALIAIVQSSFNTVWWPAVMKKYEEDPSDISFYVKANSTISLIMFLLGVITIVFKDVIVLFLGPRYRVASMLIPFLMFQPIMYTISETTVIGLTFLKKSRIQLYIAIIAMVTNLFLCIFFTKLWGIKGTSIAVGTSYILFFLLRTIGSYKYYKIPFTFRKLFFSIGLLYVFAIYETLYPSNRISYSIAMALIPLYCMLYRANLKEIIQYFRIKFVEKI